MTEATISLPFPISLNRMYRNLSGVGRVKTKDHAAWEKAAGWTLKSQRPPSFDGPVSFLIVFGPKKGRWDPSNHIKAVEDLLVSQGVLTDDDNKIMRRGGWVHSDKLPADEILVRIRSRRAEEALA